MLLAPLLFGYDAPTTRPNSGGWATPDIPHIIGLLALRSAGITCCEALQVARLRRVAECGGTLAGTYSERLMRNFAVSKISAAIRARHKAGHGDLGVDDELMFADKYSEAMPGAKVAVDVRLIEGIDHMGIVTVPRAIRHR